MPARRRVLSDFSNTMNREANLEATEVQIINEEVKCTSDELWDKIKREHSTEFLKELADLVHHTDGDLELLVEEASTQMGKNVYPNDRVKLNKNDTSSQVVTCTVRKGNVNLIKACDDEGVECSDFINQDDVVKVTIRGTKDFRQLIELIAKKNGKYWVVSDKLCRELGVKNKIHPLMLRKSVESLPRKENDPKKSGTPRASSNSSSIFNDSASHEVVKKSSKGASSGPTKPKEKLLSPSKLKAKQKLAAKTSKPEKKTDHPGEKKEKQKKSEKLLDDIKKKEKRKSFFKNTEAAAIKTSSPFLTPQKRAEKQFEVILGKLRKEFSKGTKDGFLALAARLSKQLTQEQAAKIDDDLIRYFVLRARQANQSKEALSKVSPSKRAAQKAEQKANLEKNEKQLHLTKLSLLKAHFVEISQREDLSVCIVRLELDDMISDQKSFSETLAISQAFYSLKHFLDHKHYLSAEFLYASMSHGFTGFSAGLGIVLQSFLTIIHQDLTLKVHHFGQRLQHYTIDLLSISEVCRAMLIGETEKSEEVVDEDDDHYNVENSNLIEKSIAEDLLKRFTSNIEFWELSVDDQLAIVSLIMDKVFDTEAYHDYISASVSETLKEKLDKEQSKLVRLKEELAEIPIEEPDYLTMERTRTRELEKNKKRREELQERISLCQGRISDFKEGIEFEQTQRKLAKRNKWIGMDRHFRRYYFFGKESPNHGLWIQDLGITPEEVILKKLADMEIQTVLEDQDMPQDDLKENLMEKWFCLRKPEDVVAFSKRLNMIGTREKMLKEELEKIGPLIEEQKKFEQKQRNNKENQRSTPINTSGSSLESFRDSLSAFANEIFMNRLSCLKEQEVFTARIKAAENVNCMKELLLELVESIQPSAISPTLSGVWASTTFSLQKWISFLENANTCSGFAMLLDIVHSRINWGSSINCKRCKKCGRKNNIDEKLICQKCGTCFHIYCVRPRPDDVSADWLCFCCIPPKESEEFALNRRDRRSRANSEDFEDYFAANEKKKLRKRPYEPDSATETEDEEEFRGPAARTRHKEVKPISEHQKVINALYEQIKSKRIFTSLSNLVIPRASRNQREILPTNGIEKKIDEGTFRSVAEFKDMIKKLLDMARKQLAGRKLEQIDDVEVLLNEDSH